MAEGKVFDSTWSFQRLGPVSQSGEFNLGEVMKYESSPYPSSLFETKLLQKPDKPVLLGAIRDHDFRECCCPCLVSRLNTVLD